MSSGSSSQPANTTIVITIRYAPYIEERHSDFLLSVYNNREITIDQSPYAELVDLTIEDEFFGAGYTIASYAPLYEMFGKHMSAIDLEALFNNTFGNIVGSTTINADVEKENQLLTDRMVKDIADYSISMRGINAVGSSSFIIGKSKIERKKLKAIEVYSLNKHVEAITVAENKFISNLDAYRKLIYTQANIMKDYYILKDHTDERNTYIRSRDILWPFQILDFEQAALGALVRAARFQKVISNNRGRSALSTALSIASATVTGATIGAQVGGGYGAIGGAVIGFKIGITQMLLERGEFGWVAAALTWAIF